MREALRAGPPAGRSRWTLARIRLAVAWLAPLRLASAWRVLWRLGFSRLGGRERLHSPDPAYAAKLARIAAARAEADAAPGRVEFLYQDELTFYRRPDAGPDYDLSGGGGPPAEQGHGPNTKRRLAGCLDAKTGRLMCWQRSTTGVDTLKGFFRWVADRYPEAEKVYVALDNWPVHSNPRLLEVLPAKVELLWLPTYAPWTNPIEKSWRKLRQDLLHRHRFASDWQRLREAVERWTDAEDRPNPEMLHYCGLTPR